MNSRATDSDGPIPVLLDDPCAIACMNRYCLADLAGISLSLQFLIWIHR